MKKHKFNVIDVIVLIVVIAVIAAVVYRIVSVSHNVGDANLLSEEQYMYVELYANQVVPEAVDTLKPGDLLVANGAQTTGEVVYVEAEPAAYIGVDSDGNTVLTQHPLWKDLHVIIRDKVNPSEVTLKAGGQEVRVNYTYILKTQQFEGNSKVRNIEFVPIDEAESLEPETMFGNMSSFAEE
ncbi:MAG: DUF4330 domain-containing protein [Clostridiales bacterium]|nr:DUF4330 domain-containing protein [Clostridiales bacterium]